MSEITVRELAGMALDEYATCQIWTPLRGTVFNGSFDEARDSDYADREVDSFQVEDGVFVMNI
uniref:Uncharacterized protein n=1 Tax=Siphoviridae sp. ctu9a31 TaxID=2825712 RepID=A0A8S5QAC4_9CAUD|nr:MAG TPA: hypothetical protein [Siphoviridae sp. ctu9a31]